MRTATVTRNTLETRISVSLDLDGTGKTSFNTGVPFLEHMLDQIARHGLIDMHIVAEGDLHIDAHHTVEDLGITLGQAFALAMSPCRGWYWTCPVVPDWNTTWNTAVQPSDSLM